MYYIINKAHWASPLLSTSSSSACFPYYFIFAGQGNIHSPRFVMMADTHKRRRVTAASSLLLLPLLLLLPFLLCLIFCILFLYHSCLGNAAVWSTPQQKQQKRQQWRLCWGQAKAQSFAPQILIKPSPHRGPRIYSPVFPHFCGEFNKYLFRVTFKGAR